ncbi:MAG: ABC transporter substrate-binding protein [Christensenellales bacterium]|jgi:inositol-phosphate transport system substrate-binding protein
MKTHKLFGLFVVLCLLFSFTAMAETITLKIAHNYDFVSIPDAVIAAADRLEERYAAEGKNIQIEFEKDYQRIDWGEYSKNLIFAYKNGDAPDIFSVSDVPSMVDAGMLMDISDLNTDAFVDGVFNCYTVDGKAYAMPFDLPVRVIYYNKLSLVEFGWTMEEAEALPAKVAAGEFTWEDFIKLCDDIQNAGVCTWGMSHRPGAGPDFLDVLKTLGGRYYNENGTLVFDEDAMLRFFQFIYDAANVTEITPQDLAQQGWPSINTMVGDGTCFAYYGPIYSSTYVANAVNKDPQQFANDVAFMMFPVSEYNNKPFVIAAPQGMGINAATKHPEVCYDLFVELATGSADLLADHANVIFTLSSVKAANEMEAITTNPIVADVRYMADYAISVPSIKGINTLNSEMLTAIVQLELGQITPEKAVENVKIQLELNVDEDEIVFE